MASARISDQLRQALDAIRARQSGGGSGAPGGNSFESNFGSQGFSVYRPPGELDPNAMEAHNLFSGISEDFGSQFQNWLNNQGGRNYAEGLRSYSNPYEQNYADQIRSLSGGTNTGQLRDFMNQFTPRGGDGGWENLPINMPGMERAGGAERFAAGGSSVPGLNYGAGGDFIDRLLRSGTRGPGTGYAGATPDVQTARSAQLSSLLKQAGGGGMSPDQRTEMYEASMSPVREELGRARKGAYDAASNRGFGRSTESGRNIEGDYSRRLSDAAVRTTGDITQRDLAARQRSAEFGTAGLGEYARAGVTEGLGAADITTRLRQIGNQYNLGLGGLGEQAAGRVGAGQQWSREQGFSEEAARAGMSRGITGDMNDQQLARYQAEMESMFRARGLSGEEARARASQQLETMRMGMQGQQFSQGQLSNFLLGAGGQDQSAWGTQMSNLLQGSGLNLQNDQLIGQLFSGMTSEGLRGLLQAMQQEIGRGGLEQRGREERAGSRNARLGTGIWATLARMGADIGGAYAGNKLG